MQDKNRNLLAAKALGLDYITIFSGIVFYGKTDNVNDNVFDLSDSNCRKLVIEHFKIDIFFNDVWVACVDKGIDTVDFTNPSRDKAIDMCIDKILGVEDENI